MARAWVRPDGTPRALPVPPDRRGARPPDPGAAPRAACRRGRAAAGAVAAGPALCRAPTHAPAPRRDRLACRPVVARRAGAAAARAAGTGMTAGMDGAQARVLVADASDVRTVLVQALRAAGHAAVEAGDGAEALRLIADPARDRPGCDRHRHAGLRRTWTWPRKPVTARSAGADPVRHRADRRGHRPLSPRHPVTACPGRSPRRCWWRWRHACWRPARPSRSELETID